MAKFFCWESVNERKDGEWIVDVDCAARAAEEYVEEYLYIDGDETDKYLIVVEPDGEEPLLFEVYVDYRVTFCASECD